MSAGGGHSLRLPAVAAVAAALLAAPSTASAADPVTNTNDSGGGSLRNALATANPADVIDVPAGTYDLTSGALLVNDAVTIQGAGAASTTIRQTGLDRVFTITTGATGPVTLSGMTITGGHLPFNFGAGVDSDATGLLTIANSVVTGNTTDVNGRGGGVNSDGAGGLAISGSTISANSALADDGADLGGGGVYVAAGPTTITNSTISDNVFTGLNGISGLHGGGGVHVALGAGALTVTGSTISGNSVNVEDGTSATGGGGIFANGSGVTISNSAIGSNSVNATGVQDAGSGGGGVAFYTGGSAPFTITDSTIVGNSATISADGPLDQGGGGIHSRSGGFALVRSTVSGNSLTLGAGTAGGGGGVFHFEEVGGDMTNVTISGNSLTGGTGGGGYFVDDTGGAGGTLQNTTIAGNTTGSGAGGIQAAAGVPDVRNTIVAANGVDCSDTMDTLGNNIESGTSCGFTAGGDLDGTDPALGPLASNGGPVQTRALLPGSPAVDTGAAAGCPGVDARAVTRPRGAACDIGAYEFDGQTALVAASCFPGAVPVTGSAPAGSSFDAVRFQVDGGPQGEVAPSAGAAALPVPEGPHTLSFRGVFSGAEETTLHSAGVLVDTTLPLVTMSFDEDRDAFSVGEAAPFSVTASDPGSGLTADPSVSGERASTSRAGRFTLTRTARDLCGNEATATLDYRVLPKPELGVSVNLFLIKGRVRVKLPLQRRQRGSTAGVGAAQKKGRRFIPLREARQVPVGTLVDTERGTVLLQSARNRRGTLQSGQFAAGLFQALQSRSTRTRGLTELRLKGASFNRCGGGQGGKRSAAAQRRRLSRRTVRRLSSNANGSFRTRGRHSAATVRGTVWATADRCDGTLTTVRRGRVAVRDFRRKRTVLVRAGKSYLARP